MGKLWNLLRNKHFGMLMSLRNSRTRPFITLACRIADDDKRLQQWKGETWEKVFHLLEAHQERNFFSRIRYSLLSLQRRVETDFFYGIKEMKIPFWAPERKGRRSVRKSKRTFRNNSLRLQTGWSSTCKRVALNAEEQQAIVSVIKRNEQLEMAERQRVGRLVERVERIKQRASYYGPKNCRWTSSVNITCWFT